MAVIETNTFATCTCDGGPYEHGPEGRRKLVAEMKAEQEGRLEVEEQEEEEQ